MAQKQVRVSFLNRVSLFGTVQTCRQTDEQLRMTHLPNKPLSPARGAAESAAVGSGLAFVTKRWLRLTADAKPKIMSIVRRSKAGH